MDDQSVARLVLLQLEIEGRVKKLMMIKVQTSVRVSRFDRTLVPSARIVGPFFQIQVMPLSKQEEGPLSYNFICFCHLTHQQNRVVECCHPDSP